MEVGDLATMPAIPMGYPITVTNWPGEPGVLAKGNTGRLRTASESSTCSTAKSELLETAAGDKVTGVGEPGKKTTRFSNIAVAPRSISFWASESPYQGSATWR